MIVAQLFALGIELLVMAIAITAVAGFVRYGDAQRLDVMLICLLPAAVLVAQQVAIATHAAPGLIRALGVFVVLPQPYLLVRVVRHFRPVPSAVHALAAVGFVLASAIIVDAPTARPAWWTAIIVAYVVLAAGYAMAACIRGGRETSGVMHWRLLLIASGAGLLAFALAASGLAAMYPPAARVGRPLVSLGLLGALIAYYVGFVPPRTLRAAWVFPELRRFLGEEARCPPGQRGDWMNIQLCQTAIKSIGGIAAVVVGGPPAAAELTVSGSAGTTIGFATFGEADATVMRVWRSGEPVMETDPRRFGPNEASIAPGVGALLAVPITSLERHWGVLLVGLRRGLLFPTDDINLLMMFTEQAAIALDYAALVGEQRRAAEALARTARDLQAANAELEAFSYSVSHDLRAPLRHIAGFAQLLNEAEGAGLTDTGRRFVQTIVDAAGRMGRLIDALLGLSRTGRTEMHVRPVALGALVRAVQAEIDAECQGHVCTWTIHDLPDVIGDEALLRVAFTNLLSNAVKYTRRRPRAEIEVGGRRDGVDGVVIFVRDNGAGFDMQYAGKLFGVFQRLHSHQEFDGTGIGLATVRRIVTRHGGRVWAEGGVDEGATFWMTLPG